MNLLDANIIIRFLTNDDATQSPKAYRLFERAVEGELTLLLHPLIVAECCCVLESKRYGYSKKEIADTFNQIISASGIKTIEKETIQKALFGYSNDNVDFVDAFLSAVVEGSKEIHSTVTWNVKDFRKLGAEFYTPEEILTDDEQNK